MNINSKIRNGMSFVLALFVLLSLIQPQMVEVKAYSTSLAGVEIDIRIEIDGVNAEDLIGTPIDQNSNVSIFYDWSVDNFTQMEAGASMDFVLPLGFRIAQDVEGQLLMLEGGSVGSFFLDRETRLLTITFNDFVETMLEVSGTVEINTRFELQDVGQDNPVRFAFQVEEGIEKVIEVKFAPNNTSSDTTKSGIANKAINPDQIAWTIDINRQLNPYTTFTLTDTYSAGQTLDASSFNVYQLNVSLQGAVTIGAVVDSSQYVLTPDNANNSFAFVMNNINTAYRIVYDTNIVDRSLTSFTNHAYVNELDIQATVNVQRGTLIEKSGQLDRSSNPNLVTWTVIANRSESALNELILEDSIPSGLSLDVSSINAYSLTLNNDGSIATETLIDTANYSVSNVGQQFNLNFGAQNQAIKVVYVTDIVNRSLTSFTNIVNLLDGPDNIIGTDDASVNFTRGSMLNKTGQATINYTDKYIIWTVNINTSEDVLENVIYNDIIGVGLDLVEGSIIVSDLSFNANGSIATNITSNPQPTINNTVDGFNVEFGNISSAKQIVYRTNITDLNQRPYTNTAELSGIGVPPGTIDIEYINPTIENTISKSTVTNGINYLDKTMEWLITIVPTKESMNSLVLTDTFTNLGLSFIDSSLVVNRGSTQLVRDVDYSLTITNNNPDDGFVINFLAPVNGAVYTVQYKTSFNRLDHINQLDPVRYINRVQSTWTETSDGSTRTDDDSAYYEISTLASNNGNKSGILDRTNQLINWVINVNYLRENQPSIRITDIIVGNQNLNLDSFKLFYATVEVNGSITRGLEVDPSEYTINTLTVDEIDIEILGPTDQFYQVVYMTELTGQSQSTYTNTAIVNEVSYTTIISYENADIVILKTGVQVGSIVEWDIEFNQSLSDIEDVVITDHLSLGHEYLLDSFKVYKMPGNVLVDVSEYTLIITILDFETMEQKFDLSFHNAISDIYRIEYETEITTTVNGQTISNSVELTGLGVEITDQTTSIDSMEVEITRGFGSGTGTRGSIRFVKYDSQNPSVKLAGAQFNLYDENMNSLGTLPVTNNQGEIIIDRISFGKYYIVEITAPNGYVLNSTPIEINFENIEVLLVQIPNDKAAINLLASSEEAMPKTSIEETWYNKNTIFNELIGLIGLVLLYLGFKRKKRV